jgi:hypothetical protein
MFQKNSPKNNRFSYSKAKLQTKLSLKRLFARLNFWNDGGGGAIF